MLIDSKATVGTTYELNDPATNKTLSFTFNENNEYCVNLPFQVASFVTSDLDDRQFQNDIHQISRELQKLANKK